MSSRKVSSKLYLKSLKATKLSTNLSGSCGGDTNQIANQAYVDESSSSSSSDDDDEWAIVPRYSRKKEEKEQRDREREAEGYYCYKVKDPESDSEEEVEEEEESLYFEGTLGQKCGGIGSTWWQTERKYRLYSTGKFEKVPISFLSKFSQGWSQNKLNIQLNPHTVIRPILREEVENRAYAFQIVETIFNEFSVFAADTEEAPKQAFYNFRCRNEQEYQLWLYKLNHMIAKTHLADLAVQLMGKDCGFGHFKYLNENGEIFHVHEPTCIVVDDFTQFAIDLENRNYDSKERAGEIMLVFVNALRKTILGYNSRLAVKEWLQKHRPQYSDDNGDGHKRVYAEAKEGHGHDDDSVSTLSMPAWSPLSTTHPSHKSHKSHKSGDSQSTPSVNERTKQSLSNNNNNNNSSSKEKPSNPHRHTSSPHKHREVKIPSWPKYHASSFLRRLRRRFTENVVIIRSLTVPAGSYSNGLYYRVFLEEGRLVIEYDPQYIWMNVEDLGKDLTGEIERSWGYVGTEEDDGDDDEEEEEEDEYIEVGDDNSADTPVLIDMSARDIAFENTMIDDDEMDGTGQMPALVQVTSAHRSDKLIINNGDDEDDDDDELPAYTSINSDINDSSTAAGDEADIFGDVDSEAVSTLSEDAFFVDSSWTVKAALSQSAAHERQGTSHANSERDENDKNVSIKTEIVKGKDADDVDDADEEEMMFTTTNSRKASSKQSSKKSSSTLKMLDPLSPSHTLEEGEEDEEDQFEIKAVWTTSRKSATREGSDGAFPNAKV